MLYVHINNILGALFDFAPIQETVSIPKNSMKYCFNITIIDDNIDGEGGEYFGVSFVINSDSTVAEAVSGKSSAYVYIREDDGMNYNG